VVVNWSFGGLGDKGHRNAAFAVKGRPNPVRGASRPRGQPKAAGTHSGHRWWTRHRVLSSTVIRPKQPQLRLRKSSGLIRLTSDHGDFGPPRSRHFIYPIVDITPEDFWRTAIKGGVSDWALASCFRLIEPQDWIWAYFARDVKEILGVGTVVAPVGYDGGFRVRIRWSGHLTHKLKRRPIAFQDYRQWIRTVSPANSGTLVTLKEWSNGFHAIPDSRDEDVQFDRREIKQRKGQREFQVRVMRAYGGRCAISNCGDSAVLEAAHIIPVKDRGRHSLGNSLLLRADLHRLFDSGLITIRSNQIVQIQPSVTDQPYKALDGSKATLLSGADRNGQIAALARHRKATFP
jgi:HNH endonuclease